MRDFLNLILSFIGASSLTDTEFNSLTITEQVYTVEVYESLLGVLESRESVSDTATRLKYYFLARGVEVTTDYTPKSNIFIGAGL